MERHGGDVLRIAGDALIILFHQVRRYFVARYSGSSVAMGTPLQSVSALGPIYAELITPRVTAFAAVAVVDVRF